MTCQRVSQCNLIHLPLTILQGLSSIGDLLLEVSLHAIFMHFVHRFDCFISNVVIILILCPLGFNLDEIWVLMLRTDEFSEDVHGAVLKVVLFVGYFEALGFVVKWGLRFPWFLEMIVKVRLTEKI